jgi:hypothetical protein
VQLIQVHLPGAGLCKDEERHDDGVLLCAPAALAVVDGSVGRRLVAAVLALCSSAPAEKKLGEEQFFTTNSGG